MGKNLKPRGQVDLIISFKNLLTIGCKNKLLKGEQWLSGRVLDFRPRGRRFEPHQRHCVVSLSKIENNSPPHIMIIYSTSQSKT